MKKKEYKKPQVVEVKLALQNPILGICQDVPGGELDQVGTPCSQTGGCNF